MFAQFTFNVQKVEALKKISGKMNYKFVGISVSGSI